MFQVRKVWRHDIASDELCRLCRRGVRHGGVGCGYVDCWYEMERFERFVKLDCPTLCQRMITDSPGR